MMDQHWTTTRWNSFDSLSVRSTRQWARRIESVDQIPTGFAPHFPSGINRFPYTILVPPDSLFFRHFTGASLIVLLSGNIMILSQNGNTVSSRTFNPGSVTLLEYGSVLLSSWLRIEAPEFSLKIPFNSVNHRLFDPLIETLRPCIRADETGSPGIFTERSKFDYLYTVDYKYGNFCREAICPGDRVSKILYEKDRPDDAGGFGGFHTLPGYVFRKKFRTSHCSVLTERELIIIRESEPLRKEGHTLYGKIISYIPLTSIREISIRKYGISQFIDVTLQGGKPVPVQYGIENDETEAFITAVKNAIRS